MTQTVYDEYRTWKPGEQAAIDRILKAIAQDAPPSLHITHFRAEGAYKPRGSASKMQVYAVKKKPRRIYGVYLGRVFLCTTFDSAKKRDNVNTTLLQQCVNHADHYTDSGGAHECCEVS